MFKKGRPRDDRAVSDSIRRRADGALIDDLQSLADPIACPHDEQNRLPAAFSAAQDGHRVAGAVTEAAAYSTERAERLERSERPERSRIIVDR